MSDDDARSSLREGDDEMRAGRYHAALQAYAVAARAYDTQGLFLKALAIYKQVRHIIAKHAPEEQALEDEARRRLPALYRALGLEHDARAIEDEDG